MEGTVTISTILESVGTLFTNAMSWAGTVLTTIVGNPLLLIFASLSLVGLGIGVVVRLMRIR